MTQFNILVYVEESDGTIVEHQLGGSNAPPASFDEAKNVAGSVFVGGYVHKENEVDLEPAITLYGPRQIKKVRLVPRKIIS